MSATAAGASATHERLDLLDALIYGDAFDCAVTLDELWQYARVAIQRDELRQGLRDDPVLRRFVVERDGLYCLAGRDALLSERPARVLRARRLQRRARRVARVLRHLPFVEGLVLTGSTSADDATQRADIDLLAIATVDRLGTVFLLLGSISRLLGRRLFCPNWYLCQGNLGVAPRSPYLAREIAQARSLAGKADALRDANPWITELFPNAIAPPPLDARLRRRTRLQRVLEAPLREALGDCLERCARRVAVSRLRAHYAGHGEVVPVDVAASLEAGVALGFHGFRYEQRTTAAYAARRAELSSFLEQAEVQREHTVSLVPAAR